MDEADRNSVDPDQNLWTSVARDVNAWRGAGLQCFCAVETAVTETLLHLSEIPDRGSAVRLRHLIGQRLKDLGQLLGPEGTFGAEGKAAAEALSLFREYEPLRTMLAHGQAKLCVERTGRWIAIFRHIAIRAKQPERSTIVIEQGQAEEKMLGLRRSSQKLCSILANLRKTMTS